MPRLAPLLTVVLLCVIALGNNSASAQQYFEVPANRVSFDGGAVTIRGPLGEDTFIPGLGWISGSTSAGPRVQGSEVLLDDATAQRLGLAEGPVRAAPEPDGSVAWPQSTPAPSTSAASTGIRFGGDVEVRVVVDLPQLASAEPLRRLERQGRLAEGEALVLELPRVDVRSAQRDSYRGIDVRLADTASGARFELRGPELTYRVFALEAPTRLVVDVLPLRRLDVDPQVRRLHEGVTYRTFGAPTAAGTSKVHLLEIAPNAGEFKVVGTSEVPRTLSQLADGSFAAINAGYFDTSTFEAIGLLTVDYGLQSLPSRNRASIGFGLQGPVMTRVQAQIDVRINGRLHRRSTPENGGGIHLYSRAGTTVTTSRQGALVVRDGRATANRIGPVRVPADGFVLTYPSDDRDLALVEPGDRIAIDIDFQPPAFRSVRYAVEAGPLLVENGLPAFAPELESFARGQRILDAYTQQSAIGIRPDGTVLFLVADAMRAQDLVPLFLSLGASDAMRLDSGSSATLYADGKVLNRSGGERRIVSAIVFVPSTRADTSH